MLLCSLDSTAFAVAQDTISANDACTYDDLKAALSFEFGGDEYRRSLQSVLRELIFKKGDNIQLFAHQLSSTIKDLYGITDRKAVNNIAVNHVVANIQGESIRYQVRILQLCDSEKLNSILELINAHSNSFPLRAPTRVYATLASDGISTRLD